VPVSSFIIQLVHIFYQSSGTLIETRQFHCLHKICCSKHLVPLTRSKGRNWLWMGLGCSCD